MSLRDLIVLLVSYTFDVYVLTLLLVAYDCGLVVLFGVHCFGVVGLLWLFVFGLLGVWV